MPRAILALYNSRDELDLADSNIHRFAEMTLNHLGLVVYYRDINAGLPSLQEMDQILGVLTWFRSDAMPDPKAFVSWAEVLMDSGRKFVALGDLSISRDYQNRATPHSYINRLCTRLGARDEGEWTQITYDARFIYKDPQMMGFEREMTGVLPPFARLTKIDPRAKSYLVVRRGRAPETDSHLAMISANGGYVASGYTLYKGEEPHRVQLHVNLFEFFRLAFDTDRLPKPDTTTLSGRRIYYSHIDGDGWRNLSEISGYREAGDLSAKVILEKVLKPYPELPATVAPIAADIDPSWYGTSSSLELAKAILALPNVEAGSHSYSHPLNWAFFQKGGFSEEKRLAARARADEQNAMPAAEEMRGHIVTRSYLFKPFSLKQEVDESIAYINSLLPRGKRVEIFQWSGDTLPFEAAVAAARAARVRNINGGDTRLDGEYPSYAFVSSLGRQVGRQWQIYASNCNENTYTELFTDRFFGFHDVVQTHRNTESPRRVKPANLYYHMYSGQKPASLRALLENLNYVRTQELAPITAGHYAAIADGFYSTRIVQLDERSWRIENRDELQTIRFDRADLTEVDFSCSTGVLGQRHFQGSLYVALDASVQAPVIALKQRSGTEYTPPPRPCLVQSRWYVWGVRHAVGEMTFVARGYGGGEMVWRCPHPGRYQISVHQGGRELKKLELVAGQDGLLALDLPLSAINPVTITITWLRGEA